MTLALEKTRTKNNYDIAVSGTMTWDESRIEIDEHSLFSHLESEIYKDQFRDLFSLVEDFNLISNENLSRDAYIKIIINEDRYTASSFMGFGTLYSNIFWRNISNFKRIESFAVNKEKKAFKELLIQTEWSTFNSNEILKIIDLSISLDMTNIAKKLVRFLREKFPKNERAILMEKLLAPPEFVSRKPSNPEGLIESKKWISQNAKNYIGKWIAVQNGKLLVEAGDFKTIKATIKKLKNQSNILVEKINS